MRNLYIFILLGFHLLITSCSSIRERSSNVIARQLASITGNKPSCEKLVAEVINFEEETKLSKQYKQRVANFWNNNNKHNVDDLSWFAKYELWSSNILQSWNKNPQPIFFIEDSEKSFYVISSYKRNFKSSGQVSNSNGDVIEFSEAKEVVSTWLKRYSNFEQDINYLQKKYITLIYQTKKLKSLRREGKYPFSIKVTMFKQGKSFQEVKVFKDSGRVREFLTELKIQRNQIQSPIMHTGLLKKVQFRQASDYERLKRLHNVLENIYLTQLDKDKKSINQDLRKTLIEIESVINQKKT